MLSLVVIEFITKALFVFLLFGYTRLYPGHEASSEVKEQRLGWLDHGEPECAGSSVLAPSPVVGPIPLSFSAPSAICSHAPRPALT